MKTPAKKATKAAAKAPAKVVAPSKKVSAKSPAKGKTVVVKAKTKPAATVKAKAAPVKTSASKAKAPAQAKTSVKSTQPTQVPASGSKKASKPVSVPPKSAAVKATPVKATSSGKPVAAAGKKTAVSSPAVQPPVPVKPIAPASPVSTDMPIRSSRPSARLAQITVPSMPQAVASTAAKASFLPSMPTTVLPVPTAAAKKDPKLANNWKTKPVEQLTDAEVLAMPDSEYMNDVQMAFFRLKLVQLKQGILNNAGETTEHLREDTVVVPDPADRATIEEEHALELRTRDRERKLLKKIEQSIARIDAGDYGYCDETGEPIGVGRLLARPTATLSLEAQQRRELKQKMFGD